MIQVNSLPRLQSIIAYSIFQLVWPPDVPIGCTRSVYYLQTILGRYNSIQLFFHSEFLPHFNKIYITQQLDIAVCPQKVCFQHTKPGNFKEYLSAAMVNSGHFLTPQAL